MLTTPRPPEVHLRRSGPTRLGDYTFIVFLPANHEDGHSADPLTLFIQKGKPNGEFGMTTPGRWYITSRLSHYAPTGPRGREGYPSLDAVRSTIATWLMNPDNGETWS